MTFLKTNSFLLKKPLLAFVFCFFAVSVISQNHDYVWLTGYDSFNANQDFGGTVIDFNQEPPYIYREDREMNINTTLASYYDSLGNMLLYTNGIRIANKNHEYIEGGDSLNIGSFALSNYIGGYRAPQCHVFIHQPETDTLILFHESTEVHDTFSVAIVAMLMTKIDLNANGGQGKVTSKNEVLAEGVFGTLTAAKHANGRDWWILNTDRSKNRYQRFLLSPEGIKGHTIVQVEPENTSTLSTGLITFSSDGNKLARYNVADGVYLFDFDRCDGSISDATFLPLPETLPGGGLAFSSNSRFLYIADVEKIYQFDTWADDIAASEVVVAEYDGYQSPFSTAFFLMQMGPDGRIYINCPNGVNVMHTIEYPNKKGVACEVRQHSVQLPTYNAFTMPHSPNYRLGPLDGSPCDTLGLDNLPIAKFRYVQPDSMDYLKVEFTDLSYYEPAEWYWDFGDNATSQDTSPVYTFSQQGIYEVCLTVSNQFGEDTFCRTLELGTVGSNEVAQNIDINVFPNPCTEGVNIIISDYLPKNSKIVLYDAIGQLHKMQSLQTGWNTILLDGLQAGLYFYEIWEGQVLLKSGRLVRL